MAGDRDKQWVVIGINNRVLRQLTGHCLRSTGTLNTPHPSCHQLGNHQLGVGVTITWGKGWQPFNWKISLVACFKSAAVIIEPHSLVAYTVHSAQCTVHSAQCTVHSAQCTVHSAQYTVRMHTTHARTHTRTCTHTATSRYSYFPL